MFFQGFGLRNSHNCVKREETWQNETVILTDALCGLVLADVWAKFQSGRDEKRESEHCTALLPEDPNDSKS